MEKPHLIDFSVFADERGQLMVSNFDQLPFLPQRIFFTSVNSSEVQRGGHSHKKCWQILFCLNGKIETKCIWSGGSEDFYLVKFGEALVIPPGVWSKQIFMSEDSVLGVIASHLYDSSDYEFTIPEI